MEIIRNISDYSFDRPVVTIGAFDGVHKGHQSVITQLVRSARKKNKKSLVLTFWPHPRIVLDASDKNIRLLNTLEEKLYRMSKQEIDLLVVSSFDKKLAEMSPEMFVKEFLVNKLNIGHLIFGYDHHFGKGREGDFQLLNELSEKYNFTIEKLSEFQSENYKISSTEIRKALASGNVLGASHLLGYNYSIDGHVIEGIKLGRKLGFPTANILLTDNYKLLPANGVYAVQIMLEEKKYRGILNIGTNPTINTEESIKIEVHIFEFNKFIYNQKITLEFIDRIRDEKRFGSITELAVQLNKDVFSAKECFKMHADKLE
jgi:riboflavin kinase / FMN adenylyltransferase